MNKKEYRFKERKSSIIIGNIGLGIFTFGLLIGIISSICSLFLSREVVMYGLGCFIICLPSALPFVFIGELLSKRDEFTLEFIKEIQKDLSKAKTKEELYNIYLKLENETVDENYMIRLSFPLIIKNLFKEVNSKIDILNKQ